MLSKLFIKNYLLIEELNLDFNPGFSVITGETGAGKSIILGALSLLLGKRADSEVLANKSSKCIVEGIFKMDNPTIKQLFEDADIDFDPNTIIRREILPEGKSRAFINDTPVTLSTLKSITEKTTDLHSQHENLALSFSSYRIQIIDTAASTNELFTKYKTVFSELTETSKDLIKAKEELLKSKQDYDYYTFQSEQLNNAALNSDLELEELEEQAGMLDNAEEIKSALINSVNIIDNNEFSLDFLLRKLKSTINKISEEYKHADDIVNRIESIIIEISDINLILSSDIDRAEINPKMLEKINNRIDLIHSLLSKHNAKSISELKLKQTEYESSIQNTEEIENHIKYLESKYEQLKKSCKEIANKLSKKRSKIFPSTEKYITSQLLQLGMPDAVFKINNQTSETLGQNGVDNISFIFSANKSIEPQQLEKVASGGEFSRLMLTLKSLLVKASGISTVIFDEIDTGVSGEIASKMGKIMRLLTANTQVISITHLPQVAALGDYHYKVSKTTNRNKTITTIKLLIEEERINEIASMISGEKMTIQAIENAKILLEK
jgi:DNA repair protein RecN (Recombination protein N)